MVDVVSRIWIRKNKKSYLGSGRIDLLERIRDSGSILQASRAMGMSYKAAWDSIAIINTLSNEPLVESANGGKGGGGTILTSEGHKAIEAFYALEELKDDFFKRFDGCSGFDELLKMVGVVREELTKC